MINTPTNVKQAYEASIPLCAMLNAVSALHASDDYPEAFELCEKALHRAEMLCSALDTMSMPSKLAAKPDDTKSWKPEHDRLESALVDIHNLNKALQAVAWEVCNWTPEPGSKEAGWRDAMIGVANAVDDKLKEAFG